MASSTSSVTFFLASALTSGPTATPSSSPLPTLSAAILAESFLANSSCTFSCTEKRLAEVQASPMLRILATMAPSIAASMSASSNTMKGALPPSSIAGFTTLSAASCRSLRPTSVEPVNETTRTRGSCSIALTTSPDARDGLTLTTPAGTPASPRLGIAHDQLERFAQDLAALARLLGGPGRECGAGGIHRRLGVLDRGTRDRGHRVLRCRVYDVEASAVRRLAPLSADPEIGRHIGE